MRDIFCPKCHKMLFKALNANVEIKCKCGRVVHVEHVSATDALFNTRKKIEDTTKAVAKVNQPTAERHVAELKDTIQNLINEI